MRNEEPNPVKDLGVVKARFRAWFQLIAFTGAAQLIVQAIGFVCGILVIRLLPVHEYALYTLANTMLGTMTILADGGISAGVMAQGSQVWNDRRKLGKVIATGIDLRKKFAKYSLLIALPTLIYLLQKLDASWTMTSLIALSIIPAFIAALSGSILEIPPKLHQDIKQLQKIQIEANAARLALIGATLFIFPFAALAIACSGAGQTLNNWRLRKLSSGYLENVQIPDSEVRAEILKVVKRVMPSAAYFCIASQLTIWLATSFGSSESVAQLGALGRIMAITNILTVGFNILITPRYSKLPSNKHQLTRAFIQIQVTLIAASAMFVATVYLADDLILWILGRDYTDLNHELLLSAFAAALVFLGGSSMHLCLARGMVIPPTYSIAISLFTQITLIYLIGYSTLTQILIYSVLSSAVQYLMWLVWMPISIRYSLEK